MYYTAIVLAAGSGSRMNATAKGNKKIPKQFLDLAGKPLLYYSLRTFEESFVDEIILVTGKDDILYCKKEIVEKYGFQKVARIEAGGRERYHSVYQGLLAARPEGCVLIHDGARPFLTKELLERAKENLRCYAACVAALPSKDTVKIVDAEGFVKETPDRRTLWNVQTPQCFTYELAMKSYRRLIEEEAEGSLHTASVTDDAMVVEYFGGEKVKLFEGSYYNMKVTTPEDMETAQCYCRKLYGL